MNNNPHQSNGHHVEPNGQKPPNPPESRRSYIPGSYNVSGGFAVFGDVYGSSVENLYFASTRAEIARALSYHGMGDRKRAITTVDKGSFDWVWISGFASWLKADKKLFWITGKPGSGKSTCMKHLVESSLTKQMLKSSNGEDWDILHFFFDFTSGADLPNTIEGLLRSWILQLSNYSPKSVTTAPEVLTQNVMIDVIIEALNSENKSYCLFVDGMDEYEGDVDGLLSLLIDVTHRTNIKMCLASRSVTSIELSLRELGVEKLVMQNWNNQSISRYLNSVNSIVAARRMFPCPDTVLKEIASRADGVILWARLALENILQGCNEGESIAVLRKRLEALPSEIEGLYERAISKVNPEVVFEAILYLRAIEKTGALSVRDLKALHVITDGFPDQFRTRSKNIRALSSQQFEYRLCGLCGGLLITDDESRFSAVGLSSRVIENLIDWLLPTAGYERTGLWQPNPRFRLVHETLRTYLRTSTYLRSQSIVMTVESDTSIGRALSRFIQAKRLRARWRAHAERYFGFFMLFFYFLLFCSVVFVPVIGPAFFGDTQYTVSPPEQARDGLKDKIVVMVELLPILFLVASLLAVYTKLVYLFSTLFLVWVVFILVFGLILIFHSLYQRLLGIFATIAGSLEWVGQITISVVTLLLAAMFFVTATEFTPSQTAKPQRRKRN